MERSGLPVPAVTSISSRALTILVQLHPKSCKGNPQCHAPLFEFDSIELALSCSHLLVRSRRERGTKESSEPTG
jgi:hypothetical protein